MPKAEELYSSAKGIAYDGVHLFKVGDKPIAPATLASPVQVVLLDGPVTCADGAAATVRVVREKQRATQMGISSRDLPSGYGYVMNAAGDVSHWYALSGLLYTLTYLGVHGQEAATGPFRFPG